MKYLTYVCMDYLVNEVQKIRNAHSKRIVKVSKYQKHFFLKLHCPKDERNIRQNYALACFIRQNFVQYFVTFVFWANEFQEKFLMIFLDLYEPLFYFEEKTKQLELKMI